jgi:aryl-alcohol dehydrogenase-like predicted oxidoreductase
VEYRNVGASELVASVVGLGCNNFGRRVDLARTREVVEAALGSGVTFFDTADVYGEGASETFLGEILEKRRQDVVLATKFGWDRSGERLRGSAEYVREAIDASLERLRTDYVDLYYYHRPDGVTPFDETLGAMQELVVAGKVRHLGCSNLTAEQLAEVRDVTERVDGLEIVALQNEYSLLDRSAEAEVLPLTRQLRMGFVPYFPLASGLLTGKYRRDAAPPPGSRLEGRPERLTEEVFDRLERLDAFAGERGRSLLELAVGALVSTEGIASVIAGATSADQVRANAAAASFTLSEDELAELRSLAVAAV